jgi:dolichol-phosphate mannosyltransferase
MLSVIVPIFNEEANLLPLHQALSGALKAIDTPFEIIFVNDGSHDLSLEIIKELAAKDQSVRYISLSRNFGHQVAISAGIDKCRGEYAVLIDGDGQDPPELIPEMFQKMSEGYNVVYARRKTRKGESRIKRLTASIFYRLMKRITSVNIPLDTGDFRIVDRKIIEQLKRMPERHKFLRGQISWLGFRQGFVDYERQARLAGETGYTYRKMIRLALDAITSFSNLPLRLATLSGFAFAFIGFLLLIYTLYSRFVTKIYVAGWASQMITIIFIGGIQLIGIGIIGEYINRMNDNIRNRPLYVIDETNLEP